MKTYNVYFTFGAGIQVEAESKEEAQGIVDCMDTDELLDLARDGFELQSIENEPSGLITDVEQ
jgi:hypothetical protein